MKLTKLQQGLVKFASASRIRPELAGVMTNGVTAVSTDSFRLVEITNTEKDIQPEKAIIIDGKMLKQAKTKDGFEILPEDGRETPHDVALGGKMYAKGTEGMFLVEKLAQAEDYPRYKVIMDDCDKREYVEVRLNGAYLAEIAAHLAKFEYNETVTLKVPKEGKHAVIIEAESRTEKAKALLMPMNR